MRGGLGRTLLTAFLILAILPLSAISWYAITRERHATQRQVTAKLSSVAATMEMQVGQWVQDRVAALALLAALPATRELFLSTSTALGVNSAEGNVSSDSATRETLRAQLRAVMEQDSAFRRLDVLDDKGQVLVSTDPQTEGDLTEEALTLEPEQTSSLQFITLDPTADVGLVIVQRITGLDGRGGVAPPLLLAGRLNLDDLAQTLQADIPSVEKEREGIKVYLVDASGMTLPQGQTVTNPAIEAVLAGEDGRGGVAPPLHENHIGVYRWMPELGLALVAEQPQAEAFATTDNVAAAVIGATLVVALATAVIAAVVTRQITRPIVQLTESALSIAEGDLQQRVPVAMFSKDEIGILAHVFNHMTAELESLYDDLEKKIAQRTALLQEANYRLRETEEFRSRFLAHMSHELREPLTNIIGFSRLILKGLDGPISDLQRQDLQIVYANSQHLLGLINDLLDISQIEAGLMELQLEELDLTEVINSVMATASALVRDKEIELRQEIAPDLPRVQADAARIRQVLLRLLTSAARSTERGYIAVHACPPPSPPEAEGSTLADRQVLVSVSDTGMGIAPRDLEHIFEQGENGATGVGLALSKDFVEMHGGRLWVESEMGQGSTFTFSLPLWQPSEKQ
jgi:signal transduction histidine kinase